MTAPDAKIRKAAIEMAQRAMDIAAKLEVKYVCLWLGMDGFNYAFQTDYSTLWTYEIEGIHSVASHIPSIRVSLEYKLRCPRMFYVLKGLGETLLAIKEIGLPNIGVTLDVSHTLMNRENVAYSAVLADQLAVLDNIHINDGYGYEDDALIPGSVHVLGFLELLYWLKRIAYSGYMTFDIHPHPEDPVKACEVSIRNLAYLSQFVKNLDRAKFKQIQQHIASGVEVQYLLSQLWRR
jgi:xylose isomerase